MLKVLLVDDHAVVRQGLRAYLELQPDIVVCAEAAGAASAVEQAARHRPDVAVVDWVMPDGGGLAATRGIRSASPQTRVLVLTSNLASDDVAPAFEAGALGYQLKEIGGDELLDSLWRVARDERVLHPRLAAALPQLCAGSAPPGARVDADLPSPLAGLSARERDVLLLLADGLSNTAIAERLQIGEATVKTHVGNLLGKLQLADRTQAAVWAWRHGVAGR